MGRLPDYYGVLGIGAGAMHREVRAAYEGWIEALSRPNMSLSAESRAEAQELRRQVEAAYAVLGDPRRRREYDRASGRLRSPQAAPPHPGDYYSPALTRPPAGPSKGKVALIGAIILLVAGWLLVVGTRFLAWCGL